MSLGDHRVDYPNRPLAQGDLDPDPINQLSSWLAEAIDEEIAEANAMVLATCDDNNQPYTRNVLCKSVTSKGVVFFTNYQSSKSIQLEANPLVSVTFSWLPMHRQISIAGEATKVTTEVSDEYWASRSLASQIASAASSQSKALGSRNELSEKVAELTDAAKGLDSIERPDFWGGWEIEARRVEVWQGGPSRLHDRFVYAKSQDEWEIERLWP